MTVEFTQEVSDRLSSDKYGWLTPPERACLPADTPQFAGILRTLGRG